MGKKPNKQKQRSILSFAGQTDTGMVRENNEDAIYYDAERGFAILADGMGGHNAGEVASALAIETMTAHLEQWCGEQPAAGPEPDRDACMKALGDSIERANEKIHTQAATHAAQAGMGTTVVAALFCGPAMAVAHVGDSRLYRLRHGRLEQLTEDHSLQQELVSAGFTLEQARAAVGSNIITRALGTEATVQVDVQFRQLASGDLYLLCSDGLSDYVPDQLIADTLAAHADAPEELPARLIEIANSNVGGDNISVIVIKVS